MKSIPLSREQKKAARENTTLEEKEEATFTMDRAATTVAKCSVKCGEKSNVAATPVAKAFCKTKGVKSGFSSKFFDYSVRSVSSDSESDESILSYTSHSDLDLSDDESNGQFEMRRYFLKSPPDLRQDKRAIPLSLIHI